MIYDEEAANWRRQAAEMRWKAMATEALAAAWPAPPEQPSKRPPLRVPLRDGPVDWAELDQIGRRTKARMALERAVARESKEAQRREDDDRAQRRARNSIAQIIMR